MTWKRLVIRLLDHPGGRAVLAALAAREVRRSTGVDVQFLFDRGFWVHRVGDTLLPDCRRFDYYDEWLHALPGQAGRQFADAADYWFHFAKPRTGELVVDIGAGRGEDTLAFARAVGPAGKVLAIEADPESYAFLKESCDLNRLANVFPVHVALMDAPGTVTIARGPDGTGWEAHAITDGGGQEVPAARLDDLLADLQLAGEPIGFLKMNIEGAERYALPGMRGALGRTRSLCVACHDFRAELGHGEQFRTREFVESFLRAAGFSLRSRQDDPRNYVRDHVFGQVASA